MSDRSILVTGGTGFVGGAVLRHLSMSQGHRVVAAVRQMGAELPKSIITCDVGNIDAHTNWSAALPGIDVVVHAAARVHVMSEVAGDPLEAFRKVNVQGTLALATQAAAHGVRRFVFLSSIKVNGESSPPGRPFKADDVPSPIDAYGQSKLEAEQALFELGSSTGMEIVVIRPVLVYGPGVKANFRSMMRWLDRGVPLPLGAVHNQRSLVCLDNLVDLIDVCTRHPEAAGQVFLVSDGHDLSTTQLLVRLGQALGRRAWLLPVPASWLALAGRLTGKAAVLQRLLGSLQVDINKNRQLLGWEPPVSAEVALAMTAAGFKEYGQE